MSSTRASSTASCARRFCSARPLLVLDEHAVALVIGRPHDVEQIEAVGADLVAGGLVGPFGRGGGGQVLPGTEEQEHTERHERNPHRKMRLQFAGHRQQRRRSKAARDAHRDAGGHDAGSTPTQGRPKHGPQNRSAIERVGGQQIQQHQDPIEPERHLRGDERRAAGSIRSCGVASGFSKPSNCVLPAMASTMAANTASSKCTIGPASATNRWTLRFIGHAGRNQPAYGAEHDGIDFAAHADGGQRVADFVQRDADKQHADHHQAGAHRSGSGSVNARASSAESRKKICRWTETPHHRPRLKLQRWTEHPGMRRLESAKELQAESSLRRPLRDANRQPRRPIVSYQPRQKGANRSLQLPA